MDKLTNGKQIALEFVKVCIEQGIPLHEAYLFGSWVKGTQDADSDVDVALVANSFGKNIIDNVRLTALINYNFPDVEVHHFSCEDFYSNDPFTNEIRRTGVRVYKHNSTFW